MATPTAGKWGSKSVGFLLDGYSILSAKLQSLGRKKTVATEPTDGLGDEWPEHTPTGMRGAELTQTGAFFDTSSAAHTALHNQASAGPQTTQRVACIWAAGSTNMQPFMGFEGLTEIEYEVLSTIGKLQRANAVYRISGQMDDGDILHALSQETADANTEADSVNNAVARSLYPPIPITSSSVANPSVITTPVPHGLRSGDSILIAGHAGSTPDINGVRTVTVLTTTTFTITDNVTVGGAGGTFLRGRTSNGGVGYLQITQIALGGHDAASITVRHSADNVTFADLAVFTAATAIGAERKAVAAGTTVNRYMAVALDFTGAGTDPTCTFFVGFARAA